ncbi:MAG: dihydropteroate synthase [Ginsengibacter sp.]
MFTLNCKGKLVSIDKAMVMGIINTSANSFYPASSMASTDAVVEQAGKMIMEGADFLDVGGQSSKPGSLPVSENTELDRVLPAIEAIVKNYPEVLISVDTYRSKVAAAAVNAGACIINDISGGEMDAGMLAVAGSLRVPYICMHMKGTPETMQQEPAYEDVTKEVCRFFIQKVHACEASGIHDIIMDPGFGFGKSITQNFQLLKNLPVFKMFNKPLLIGISRKSTVYKTLGISVDDALNGSTVLHTLALMNGANILRVHDVKEAKEAVLLFEQYTNA